MGGEWIINEIECEMDYRMYILVNEDIKISKGKLAGQVGHAVSSYMWKLFNGETINKGVHSLEILEDYMNATQKKIILKCSQAKLEELESDYVTIRDNGLTELEPNTLTCVNIGILDKDDVPNWIKELKLYH